MTTTAYQWIIDNCVDLQINKRAVVAQTVARDQTVRATSRGGQLWRLTVTPSSGARWSESRAYIEAIDKADKFTPAVLNFNRTAFKYIFGYRGNSSLLTGWSASVNNSNDLITLTAGTAPGSGYRLRAGDLVQLTGTNSTVRVYTVLNDVVYNGTQVQLNRPITEPTGTYTMNIAQNCNFTMLCTQLPDYKIVAYDRLEWSGTFSFIESIA